MVPTTRATMMFIATSIATQSKINITDTQVVGRTSSAAIYADSMSILRKTYEINKSRESIPKRKPFPVFDWQEFVIILFLTKNMPTEDRATTTTKR